jgi:hypothetical protein
VPAGNYASAKLKLRATIGDTEYASVVGFAANNFAINQIPSATLILPIGRDIGTDTIAKIHAGFTKIETGQDVKVYLTATYGSIEGVRPDLPDGKETLIFEGSVTGTAWSQPEDSGAQFLVAIQHWLGGLDESSAISGSSHPGNPAAWTFPVIFRQIGSGSSVEGGASTPDQPNFIPAGRPLIATDLNDLWKSVFLKRMIAAAKDEPIDRALINPPLEPGGDPSIIDALLRMTPQLDGTPLALETTGTDAGDIAAAITSSLNQESGLSWVNTTLWGKLVGEWAASYFFSVVPRVSDALVVPFTGGLQGKPWSVIGVDDYSSNSLSGSMPRVLRAVGIVHPILYETGFDVALAGGRVDRTGCCGFYQPPQVTQGVVLVKDAPRWLCDPHITWRYAPPASGVGPGLPINTANDAVSTEITTAIIAATLAALGGGGVVNAAALAAGAASTTFEASQRHFRDIMNNVAHQWYVLEMLKGRTGEVGGKLRFDIAPGSNIMLEMHQATNIPANRNTLPQRFFATVTSVSYMIDAENQQAWTGFSLAHLRNEAENTAEGTSVVKPPLYKQPWRGAPLIRGFIPEPGT